MAPIVRSPSPGWKRGTEEARSADGLAEGSCLHGIFSGNRFRGAWFSRLGVPPGGLDHAVGVERVLDALAAHLEAHVDVSARLALAR